jgi:uncharacterized membrane protein
MGSRHVGDLHVEGTLTATIMGIPDSTVVNADVAAAAAIVAEKLEHQYEKVYAQESDTKSADAKQVIHVVHGATGDIEEFEAGINTTCAGASTVTVDLVKWRAGTSATCLTAVITLDSSNSTSKVPEDGTITGGTLAHEDVLEVVIDATDDGSNAVGNGVFASAKIREDAD